MTEQEVIKHINLMCCDCNYWYDGKCHEDGNCFESMQMSIKALEKKIAKKPQKQTYKLLIEEGWEYACPNCKAAIGVNKKDTMGLTQHEIYCPECGQKLDWE